MRSLLRYDNESGFSLGELLVVIIIIGILAAVAVPVYLHQRQRAWQAEARSDLHGFRTQVLDQMIDGKSLTDHMTYVTALKQAGLWNTLDFTNGDTIEGKTFIVCATKDAFAIGGYSGPAGKAAEMLSVHSDEGTIKKAVIAPGTNLAQRFCDANLPGATYHAWAHGALKNAEATSTP